MRKTGSQSLSRATPKAASKTTAKKTAHKRSGAVHVRVAVLAHGEGLPLPAYQSEEAAGLDLVAAVDEDESVVIAPRKRALIPTGLLAGAAQGLRGSGSAAFGARAASTA